MAHTEGAIFIRLAPFVVVVVAFKTYHRTLIALTHVIFRAHVSDIAGMFFARFFRMASPINGNLWEAKVVVPAVLVAFTPGALASRLGAVELSGSPSFPVVLVCVADSSVARFDRAVPARGGAQIGQLRPLQRTQLRRARARFSARGRPCAG